jgi:hypothetical protein
MTVMDHWTCTTRQVIRNVCRRRGNCGIRQSMSLRPELRNPDHAPGGSTPFWWVNEREKGTFDFSKVGSGGKTPGAMPDAPHGEDGTPRAQRVVSQNDVLERYDEDSRNRTGGAALSQQDLCAHSEC